MDGVSFVVDSTGKITGYSTNTGGADTVFPFSSKNLSLITTGQMNGNNVSRTYTFDKTYDNVFCVLSSAKDNDIYVTADLSSSNPNLIKSQVYTCEVSGSDGSWCVRTIYGTLKDVKIGDTITFTGKWVSLYMIFSL